MLSSTSTCASKAGLRPLRASIRPALRPVAALRVPSAIERSVVNVGKSAGVCLGMFLSFPLASLAQVAQPVADVAEGLDLGLGLGVVASGAAAFLYNSLNAEVESEYYDKLSTRCQQEKTAKHRLWTWGSRTEARDMKLPSCDEMDSINAKLRSQQKYYNS
eukprot:gene10785-16930_t